MRVLVLGDATPSREAIRACQDARADAVLVAGQEPGSLAGLLAAEGLRVAAFTGDAGDPEVLAMAVDLYGAGVTLLHASAPES